jgi:MFS family permease
MNRLGNTSLELSLAVIRSADFRRFLAAAVLTTTGLWLFETSLYWIVLTTTRSATSVGLVFAALIVPTLFLVVPVGIVTDRWGAKPALIFSQVAWLVTIAIATLIAQLGSLTFSLVLVLALLDGVFNAVWLVPAQVMIGQIVKPWLMPNAIGLGALQFAFGRILGGIVAGQVLTVAGPPLTLGLSALTMTLGAFVLWGVPAVERHLENRTGPRPRDFIEALSWTIAAPPVLCLIVLGAAVALFCFEYIAVLPVVSQSILHSGANGLGLMTAAGGVGIVVTALTTDALGRWLGRGATLLGAIVCASLAIALIGISRSLIVSVALSAMITGSLILYISTNNLLLQALTPPKMRGRVLSIYAFVFWAIVPLSSIGAGILVDRLGATTVLLAMGLMMLLALAVLVLSYRSLLALDVALDGSAHPRAAPQFAVERPSIAQPEARQDESIEPG